MTEDASDRSDGEIAVEPEEQADDSRLQEAVAALQAGKLREAEQYVRAVLTDNSDDPQALHLLAVIAHQGRNPKAAIELAERAVASAPDAAAYRNTLGFLYRLARRPSDAVEHLKKALELRPDYPEALNNLGIAYSESNQVQAAVEAYEKVLESQPEFPEALNNLGNALARAGRLDDAIARYDEAIGLREGYAEAWSNKGDALQAKGKDFREKALACYEKATALNPRWADAWFKFGVLLNALERPAEAESAMRKALRLNPNHLRCLVAIGALLEKVGKLPSAASHLRHALTIAPDDTAALKSLGHVTLKLGNAVEAKHVLARARELAPADPDTLYSYANCLLRMEQLQPAMDLYLRVRELQPKQARGTFAPAAVLLMDGQYEKGWAAYESRYNMSAFRPNVPNIRERLWDGSPLDGRRLLVHVEQGFGDTIQFCRYLPKLREKLGSGGKIIFLCEHELYRVMRTLPGVDELFHLRQKDMQIVFDAQVPLLSLPHRFGTTVQTIPAQIPYLGVPEDAALDDELPTSPKATVRAAIAWTGRPTHSDNIYRSIPLEQIATLFDIEGVDFHSIQIGAGSKAIRPYLERENVFDHSDGIKDFADTAAILAKVDVLITVDTAVCHLAGAMGKDVWTMLPFGGEWRWLRNREDTPYYPSMRLVRQKILGDWGLVVERVREGLENAVATRREKGEDLTRPAEKAPAAKKGTSKKAGSKKGGSKKTTAKKSAKKSASKKT